MVMGELDRFGRGDRRVGTDDSMGSSDPIQRKMFGGCEVAF
jgi:hypothetical protein